MFLNRELVSRSKTESFIEWYCKVLNKRRGPNKRRVMSRGNINNCRRGGGDKKMRFLKEKEAGWVLR